MRKPQRPARADLVNSLAEGGGRQLEVASRVGGDLLGLVQLQGEVHSSLEIEPELERNPLFGPIRHHPAVNITLPQGHIPGNEIEDAQGDQPEDYEKACAD